MVPRASTEVPEERKVGLIGSSERDRHEDEGDGPVNLGLVSTFAHDRSAHFCFGGSIGEAFTDRGAF